MSITKLVLIRHGESKWNNENRFTGWHDIDLSERGIKEAKAAGKRLKQEGFKFDYAYTSLLKRAIHTLWSILDELDQSWLPIEKSWKLNERHYGALQGLNKSETAKKYGEEQVMKWRRSFSTMPPKLAIDDERHPRHDFRYSKLQEKELPLSESLAITVERVVPYWNEIIFPRLRDGDRILIVAHGNTLRALIKYLDNMDEEKIIGVNIPTGIPIIYEFDKYFKPITHYYLENFL